MQLRALLASASGTGASSHQRTRSSGQPPKMALGRTTQLSKRTQFRWQVETKPDSFAARTFEYRGGSVKDRANLAAFQSYSELIRFFCDFSLRSQPCSARRILHAGAHRFTAPRSGERYVRRPCPNVQPIPTVRYVDSGRTACARHFQHLVHGRRLRPQLTAPNKRLHPYRKTVATTDKRIEDDAIVESFSIRHPNEISGMLFYVRDLRFDT
jgi:hypothetical protein